MRYSGEDNDTWSGLYVFNPRYEAVNLEFEDVKNNF